MLLLWICYSVLLIEVRGVKLEVEQGWIEGEQLELITKDGYYYSFKGVPYAAPPIGELRFKPPQPLLPWDGVRDATKHGSICIQYDIFSNKIVYGSEDCLFLNIYTPELHPETPLPVMFYIHGGGFESDSGNVDNYGPDFLVQNGVIVITINYRLEVLGFLSLDTEEVPGNAGMKDQVAALRWVQKNIRNFGGDPDNVTIFGQSAGGASSILHMLSPMSKGLFKRVISMSGVPSCDWAIPYQPRKRAFVLGKELGLDTKDDMKLFKFLQNVPVEKLVGVSPNVLTSEEITGNILKMFHFTPVLEKEFNQKHFLTKDPETIIKHEMFDQVDFMIGHTNEEGISDLINFKDSLLKTYSKYEEMLVPRKILLKNTPDEIIEISDITATHYFGSKAINEQSLREFLNYINDSTYFYDIYRYVKMLSRVLSKNIFVYNFSGVSKRNIYGDIGKKYNLHGASHLDDTAYIFDPKHANLVADKNSTEYKMVQQTTKLLTNFAKYGDPTPDESLGIIWPAYNNITEAFMDIGEDLTPRKALDSDAATFWKTVFDKAGLEF